MKRTDLMKLFSKNGWWVLREGGSHTVVTNGEDIEIIPRHREINEQLARKLIKKWDLK